MVSNCRYHICQWISKERLSTVISVYNMQIQVNTVIKVKSKTKGNKY